MAIINGYNQGNQLSSGTFCDSFEASKGGKKYFMKVYKDPTVMSKDYKDFIKNQDRMIPRLNALGDLTETIVDSFEVEKEGRYYQIKEFIEGATNLQKWMEENTDSDMRLDVAIQFCKILIAVHGKKIIHQDLKPAQVMTVKDSSKVAGVRIILTDFDWSIPDGHIVRTVGTVGYQSPESADRSKISYKTDIFTFGIILCELLTGGNPYLLDPITGNTRSYDCFDGSLWQNWVSKKDYMIPKNIYGGLPDSFNDIILRCLDPAPGKRPSLDDILKVLQGKVPVGGSETPSPPRRKPRLIAENGQSLLMVTRKGYVRDHFKVRFNGVTDEEGNPIYKYLDKTYTILYFEQKGDQLYVSCPANGKAKNEIRLNGKALTNNDTLVNTGDKVSIFSTSKGKDIAIFKLEII